MVKVDFDWNQAQTRFRARAADADAGSAPLAFADVRINEGTLIVLHTETDPAHEGEGLASRLTRELLDQARSEGWHVDPRCPYTTGWLERHPEYADLRIR